MINNYYCKKKARENYVTSCHVTNVTSTYGVTSGHVLYVTSGYDVTSGSTESSSFSAYEDILYYYFCKKKAREITSLPVT
jgi:hypothetical protein